MKLKGKNAISLIVLVITILVLSILAATVIISLSNTNIISETSKTVFKSDMATYKEAYEMYVASELAKNAGFDRTTLNLTYQDDEFSKIFGNVSDKYKEGLKIVDGELVYESSDEDENEVLNEVGMILKISKKKSYVGCFVDTTGNGKADGVIFADLCIQSYGEASQVSESTVKDYKITQENYTVQDAPGYGTHPLLTAIGSGEDRFFVMKLSDEYSYDNTQKFSWLQTEEQQESFNGKSNLSGSFGAGKSNTEYMISSWGGNWPNSGSWSIWSYLNYNFSWGGRRDLDLSDLEWFVPSSDEWGVFMGVLGGSNDYESFGLADKFFWCSNTEWYYNDSCAAVCGFLTDESETYSGVNFRFALGFGFSGPCRVRMARIY